MYANWRLQCEENRRLKLTDVGEVGPKFRWPHYCSVGNWFSETKLKKTTSVRNIVSNRTPNFSICLLLLWAFCNLCCVFVGWGYN